METPRLRVSPAGLLVVAVTVFFLLLLAAPAPAAFVANSTEDGPSLAPPGSADQAGLTAIDVPEGALPVLQRLGIPYQDEERAGLLRAAATAEQLAALHAEGVAVTEIGGVSIMTASDGAAGAGLDNPDSCYGINTTDYSIPYNSWVYSRVTTSCTAASGATVTSVDIYYRVVHYWAEYEVDLYLASNWPAWATTAIETFDTCGPDAPILDSSGLQDWNKWKTGITAFNGRPVNQPWDLVARDRCNAVTPRYIDYWQIWVYYTPAPTRTPTYTPTRTPTPVCFSGHVYQGYIPDQSIPIQGVTVQLFCSQSSGAPGWQIASTTTNASGYYQLCTQVVCEYYTILETDKPGYVSTGATSVDGTVLSSNRIQYTYPLLRKTLTNNNFWDVRASSPTPTFTPTATRTSTRPPGSTWTFTPTGTKTRTATPTSTPTPQSGPGLRLEKKLLTDDPTVVSQTVTFEIDVYNVGNNTVNSLFLNDVYSTTYLTFLSSSLTPNDSADDGSIEWNNILSGPLPPNGVISLTVSFHARAPTGQLGTDNCAAASYSIGQVPVLGYGCATVHILAPPPRIDIDKYLLSPPIACVSDTVVVGISYTNTGPVNIGGIIITDTYNTSQLSLRWPMQPDDGEVNGSWGFFPSFPPKASDFVTIAFHAEAPANPAINTASIKPLTFGSQGSIATDSAGVTIYAPGPCEGNAIVNGGFEGALAPPWLWGGSPPPARVSDQKHSGSYSLRLGGEPLAPLTISNGARQSIFVPGNVAHAQLSFWYMMRTADTAPYDQFAYQAASPSLVKMGSAPIVSNQWTKVTVSLDEFRGQTVWITFAVRQDSTLPTTVWLDDVQVCFATCGPGDGDTPPGGGPFCWKQRGYPDYAPEGVPDFSQQQSTWVFGNDNQWSHDAAVAAANSLWWFDSKFETGTTPPPAISDHYGLVTAYGAWDDHAPNNVAPLVNDLARRMNTNSASAGTYPADVAAGIREYLQSKNMAISYTVTYNDAPRWDWVREEVKRSEDVILLLGFWEQQADGWKRLGGHYVTAAGVSCYGDSIAISDPWRDNAEAGGPGHVSLRPHAHPTAPPDALHNDARYVSQDVYGILTTNNPGGRWGLARYAPDFASIANFMGVNVPVPYASYQAERYRNGHIVTVVERAIAVSPAVSTVTMRLDPLLARGTVGEVVRVDLLVEGTGQRADAIAAYLDFDPALLTLVDAAGNPATRLIAGPDFVTPTINSANNTTGQINLLTLVPGATDLTGRKVLATLLFKPKVATAAYGSAVNFVYTGERRTDIMSGGGSVLGEAVGGFVAATGGRTLNGTVALQGRPNPPNDAWKTPLMLTIHEPGSAMPLAAFTVNTDSSGHFTVGGIPVGTYDLKLKGIHTLRNRVPGAELIDGANNVDFGLLLEGDANNDNTVSATDMSLWAASAGKSSGQPGFDARADFDGSGTVDDADLALLQANFGKSGDVTIGGGAGPTFAQPLTVMAWGSDGVALDAATVNLSLLPVSNTLNVGQMFTLTVQVNAGGQAVHAVQMHLDLPSGLNVVTEEGTPFEIIEGSITLPLQVINHVDNGAGTIDYAASYAGTAPSGTFTLATIRLRAGQPVNNMPIRFVQLPGRMTDVIYGEESVLGALNASWVSVSGYSLYLPVIVSNR